MGHTWEAGSEICRVTYNASHVVIMPGQLGRTEDPRDVGTMLVPVTLCLTSCGLVNILVMDQLQTSCFCVSIMIGKLSTPTQLPNWRFPSVRKKHSEARFLIYYDLILYQ